MKRIISLIIILCLVLGSFSFAFAEAWTTNDVYMQQQRLQSILNYVLSIDQKIPGLSNGQSILSIIDGRLAHIESWLVPSGANSQYMSLWDYVWFMAQQVQSLWGGWDSYFSNLTAIPSFMNTNHNDLDFLQMGLVNYAQKYSINRNNYLERQYHSGMFTATEINNFKVNALPPYYQIRTIQPGGNYNIENTVAWNGSPLGNIMLLLQKLNYSNAMEYTYRWAAELTHYNDNLTTWDSQGDTLQQIAFTPDSAIQGLYRYLAFTQRDVARLTYVLASDEEIEAREEARANQTEVFDKFIDPNGSGSASVNDFADVSSASGNVKQNFSTGYSASSIWDIFNQDHYGWFSQECADALDTTNVNSNMRKSNNTDYPTPLLDAYYEEILSLGGVKDD